jgi:hypothetical protein
LDSLGFILGLLSFINGSVELLSESTFFLLGLSRSNFTLELVNGFVGFSDFILKLVKSLSHSSDLLLCLSSLF